MTSTRPRTVALLPMKANSERVKGKNFRSFNGKPLFRWMFPFDTFVFTEQMMEWTLADGTLGYGMVECGFNFPWRGNGN